MSSDRLPITVLIPVFNEAAALHGVLARLARLAPRLPEGSEILLIDDGSTDGSAEILAALPHRSMRAIRHLRNKGYGAALKTGIAQARNELIAIADSDGTYPLAAIPGLALRVASGRCAMAVGARPPSQVAMVRRPAKAVLRFLAEHLTRREIPDLNSGLRVFRRRDALRLRPLLPDQFSFTTTITMALLTEGEEVEYVPIRYGSRAGHSKIRPISDTLGFTLLILRMAVAFNPMRVFGPFAAILLLAAAGMLVMRLVSPQPFGVATTVICAVAGLQVLAIGLLADLVNRRR